MIGHPDFESKGRDMGGELPEDDALGQQDCKVKQTKRASSRGCHSASCMQREERSLVAVRSEDR